MDITMSTFSHPITLTGPAGASETLDVVVDTSILFAVIPTPVLRRLGVEPREIRRPGDEQVAQVEAELNGERGWAMCVLGPEDEPARIGRHTLDSFLLEIDSQKQKLVPKTLRLVQHF